METGRVRRESISQCAFPSESVSRPQLEAHCHIHYLLPAFNEGRGRGREASGRQGREGSWAETEAARCGTEPGEG